MSFVVRVGGFAASVVFATGVATFAAQAQAQSRETLQQMQAACARGDMPACVRAGRALRDGAGAAIDKAAALSFFRRACDGNDGDGCGLQGWLTFIGEGTARDFDAGYALMQKGCDDLQSGESCYLMSVVNLDSDYPELLELGGKNLMAACAFGYTDGCYELGWHFLEGTKGFAHDVAGALLIWESEACDKGHAGACAAAGFVWEHNEEISRDPVAAVKLYRKACDAGEGTGCFYLGVATDNGVGGLVRDPVAAARFYASGCDGDVGSACSSLAIAYRDGRGVPRDAARADALDRKGCELESPLCEQSAAAAPTLRVAGMQLGVDTVASVERDIEARGGSPLKRDGGGAAKVVVSTLDGDYEDSGPDVSAVNFFFDAADSTGRLIQVMIVRYRSVNLDPAPYATLVAERKSAIAKDFGPLQQKSPTEFTGTAATAGIQVTIYVSADTGFLREVFTRSPND